MSFAIATFDKLPTSFFYEQILPLDDNSTIKFFPRKPTKYIFHYHF